MGKSDQGITDSLQRYQVIPRVLVFLRNGSDVLLLKGAPNKRLWPDLFNGVGGHIEVDEDIFSAASREVKEETGLDVNDLELMAITNIDAGEASLGIMVFTFVGWTDKRQTTSSMEGELYWVPVDNLMKLNLVPDLAWLLPKLFEDLPREWPLFLHYSYNDIDELVIRQSEP
jgi:8-oxo-dGTP diphosphatase